MIEVNLLPGGKKGKGSKMPSLSFSMPDFKNLPVDKWVLGAAAVAIIGLGTMGWLYAATNSRTAELTVGVEVAARDSARYADLISKADQLRLRRDSIAQRVTVIQNIDGARYVWPHLLDEVARALPDYTWMTNLLQVSTSDGIRFRIQGRAGNNFAMTRFMQDLEASPFIRNVVLISTAATEQTGAGGVRRLVHEFTLEASYRDPPPEILQTVPLFGPTLETE
jgi:Tfp pilus assembly protein PilN